MFIRGDDMNTEHTKKLVTDFPDLYEQVNWGMQDTAMCWGFDVDDGWFNLIYNLSAKIVKADPKARATQVKEKYGELSFYISAYEGEVFDLVNEAEDASTTICEVCGKEGTIRGKSWLKTLCKDCATELNYA